ncbi:MAG: helix-turn-helix domain-containing protein [Desulfobacteraceae bacterium]|jgi:DNA-binding XRE family transcriptional regulator
MAFTINKSISAVHHYYYKAGHTGYGLMAKNSLKKIRESILMSKAELAKKANVSPITIDRIEKGLPCRMETKRKIILALNFKLSDKDKIFGE